MENIKKTFPFLSNILFALKPYKMLYSPLSALKWAIRWLFCKKFCIFLDNTFKCGHCAFFLTVLWIGSSLHQCKAVLPPSGSQSLRYTIRHSRNQSLRYTFRKSGESVSAGTHSDIQEVSLSGTLLELQGVSLSGIFLETERASLSGTHISKSILLGTLGTNRYTLNSSPIM